MKWTPKPSTVSLLLALAIASVYCYFGSAFHVFDVPRLRTTDFFFQIRNATSPLQKSLDRLVVVQLDDESFRRIGMRWPYKRDVYAALIRKLAACKPNLISFDFVFAGEDTPKSDALFRKALEGAGNVILAAMISPKGELIASKQEFRKSALASGIINKPRDTDDVIRRARTFYQSQDQSQLEWSWEAQNFLKASGLSEEHFEVHPRELIFTSTDRPPVTIPILKDQSFDINFYARPNQFHAISFWRVLTGQFKPEEIQGKVVLVGLTSAGFHDIENTPFGLIPGVYINANALMTLLESDFMKRIPEPLNLFLIFAFAVLTAFFAFRFSPIRAILLVVVMTAGFFAVDLVLFYFNWMGDFFSVPVVVVATFIVVSLYRLIDTVIENVQLREEAIHDPLTKLFTRRFMEVKIRSEIARVLEFSRRRVDAYNDLCLILMDIDRFKTINDTYGHQAGDRVLRNLANLVRQSLRSTDVVARYGGEEICLILPSTLKKDALMIAEKVRKAIEQGKLLTVEGYQVQVTVSLGVASVRDDQLVEYDRLVKGADLALYQAKNTGRNRVCAFQPKLDAESHES